jgi:lipocalin
MEKYMGKWFEVARLKNPFESTGKGSIVTAEYTDIGGGQFEVINTNESDGNVFTRGHGTILNEDGSDIIVIFDIGARGEYQIHKVGPVVNGLYSWAIVGSTRADSWWILCRDDIMPTKLYMKLLLEIRKLGYDTGYVVELSIGKRSPRLSDALIVVTEETTKIAWANIFAAGSTATTTTTTQ